MTRNLARFGSFLLALGLSWGAAGGAAEAAPRHHKKAVPTHDDAEAASDRAGEKVHVVAHGQTLAKIAKRYRVSVADLRAANDLAPGERLKVGSRLVIPTDDGGGKRTKARDTARDDDDDRDRDRRDSSNDADDDRGAGRRRGEARDSGDRGDRGDRDRGAHRASRPDESEGRKGGHHAAAPRTGYLHVVHGSDAWDGKLYDKKGKLSPRALDGFARILRSSDGKKHPIDHRLVALIGDVSDHFNGRTLEVVSGFRPFTPNQYTAHSRHNQGLAMDFHVRGIPNEELRDFCKTFHNVGVGYYPNSSFVHLDVREGSTTWVDFSKPGEAPRYHKDDASRDDDPGAEGTDPEHDGKGAGEASAGKSTDDKPGEAASKTAGEGSKKTSDPSSANP